MTDTVGIPVVVASGNSAKDSCGVAPARVPTAITVAASNLPTKFGRTRAGGPGRSQQSSLLGSFELMAVGWGCHRADTWIGVPEIV